LIAVHIRAQPGGWSLAVSHNADDAGLADALSYLEAKLAKVSDDDSCGPRFGKGEFGVLVEVLENLEQTRRIGIDGGIDLRDYSRRQARRGALSACRGGVSRQYNGPACEAS
jgi:hypothetical protein